MPTAASLTQDIGQLQPSTGEKVLMETSRLGMKMQTQKQPHEMWKFSDGRKKSGEL